MTDWKRTGDGGLGWKNKGTMIIAIYKTNKTIKHTHTHTLMKIYIHIYMYIRIDVLETT